MAIKECNQLGRRDDRALADLARRNFGEDLICVGGRHGEANEASCVCEIENDWFSIYGRMRRGEREKSYPSQQKPLHFTSLPPLSRHSPDSR